jgi:hypothetical protein
VVLPIRPGNAELFGLLLVEEPRNHHVNLPERWVDLVLAWE